MTHDDAATPASEPALQRRMLLRGGAVLAGAAGATVVASALAPTEAKAANGDPLTLGTANAASATTAVTSSSAAADPALTLTKTAGGPQLRLTASEVTGPLALGDLQNTPDGPVVGVDDGEGGTATDYVALGIDLDQLAVPVSVPPRRLIDTRSASGRAGILNTDTSALDSSGRLKGGKWLEFAVGDVNEPPVEGAFLNLTALDYSGSGFATAYPSGDRPNSSSLNYNSGKTTGNFAFVGTGLVDGLYYAIRVYVSTTTHVVVDLTGLSILGPLGQSTASPANRSAARRKRPASRRISRAVVRKVR